ncbi:hypothetical protein A0J61_03256 [Choanephora cucurbitarum]|uniref:Uncharacterized protein n=1 Tax=Choanephora cucurbitarum TaxID=101091 RepID=A0A1C7NHV4_9FUNG|nr:hypothetical protein A0J61_03256 [Choanephora cucurbitarum]
MAEDYQNNTGRKSSSATIVPPLESNIKPESFVDTTLQTELNLNTTSEPRRPFFHLLQNMIQKVSRTHTEALSSRREGVERQSFPSKLAPESMDDEEKQFSRERRRRDQNARGQESKRGDTVSHTKRLIKAWFAAGFMIMIGSLIAAAFILTGLKRSTVYINSHHAVASSSTMTPSANMTATNTVTITITTTPSSSTNIVSTVSVT